MKLYANYIRLSLVVLLFALLVIGHLDHVIGQSSSLNDGIVYARYEAGDYRSANSDQAVQALADTGAAWITILVTQYQFDLNTTSIYPTEKTPTDPDLIHVINQAKEQGLKVMLKPHIDIQSNPREWRGRIGRDFTEQQWADWFASYREFIGHYADLAEAQDIDQFIVGTELVATAERETQWREVVSHIRGKFSGPLTYSANHSGEETSVTWWDALDFIGVSGYYDLTDETNPTVAELKIAWEPHKATLQELHERWNKPILFTEVGYRSSDGNNRHPWCHWCDEAIDLQEQADGYQAFLETFPNQSWYAGAHFWGWRTESFRSGPCDTGYSPYDKPAEHVLRAHFGTGSRTIPSSCSDDPTPTPTLTPTLPPHTPGSNDAVINAISSPLQIDGSAESLWQHGNGYLINKVILGDEVSASDLKASFRALYDANYLYLLVDVVDDQIVKDSGDQVWEDDVIELYLDGNHSRGSSYDGQDDFQFLFRLGDGQVHVGAESLDVPEGVRIAMLSTDSGYLAEIALPVASLNISPVEGTQFGIDLQVIDDDDGGSAETKYTWHADSDDAWTNPSLIGTGRFLGQTSDNTPAPTSQPATATAIPPTATPAPVDPTATQVHPYAATVTNCSDFGNVGDAGTLADALATSNIIDFGCSGTIIVPEVVVESNLVLNGQEGVILSGNDANPILRILEGIEVEINDMILTDGSTEDLETGTNNQGLAGNITNLGTLRLKRTVVKGGFSRSQAGNIYNAGDLTMQDSIINGGTAEFNAAAILNDGDVIFVSSILSGFFGSRSSLVQNNSEGTMRLESCTINGIEGGRAVLISNNGALTMDGCAIQNSDGAGIISNNSSLEINESIFKGRTDGTSVLSYVLANNGSVTVTNSSISSYTSVRTIISSDNAILSNVTVSGNSVADDAVVDNSGTMTIRNSTLTENGSGNERTDVFSLSNSGSLNLSNTIVAHQKNGSNCGGETPVTSNGYNLDSDGSCGFTQPTDISSGNANLGPLQENGSQTLTHALLSGSDAIDAGDCSGGTVSADQRGVPRPQGAACDIGAFEVEQDGSPPTPAPPTATTQPEVPTPTATPDLPTPIPTATTQASNLELEAESGQLSGDFAIGYDALARNGAYVHVPDGLGNRGAGIDPVQKVQYIFSIAEAGNYRIKAWVSAPDIFNNSFYLQVNGEPTHGTVWHTQLNANYASEYVTDTNGTDVLEVNLDAGVHTVDIYLREDGTRLDKIGLERVGDPTPTTIPTIAPTSTPIATGQSTAVPTITATPAGPTPAPTLAPTPASTSSPSGCAGLVREAEAGELSGFFTVTNSDAASNGAYVHVPDGSGNRGTQIDVDHKTRLCFTITEPGIYRIKGWVSAPDIFNNSFYVQANGTPSQGSLWHTQVTDGFGPDYVSDNGQIVELNLGLGEHFVDFFLREDGTGLDKVTLERVEGSASSLATGESTVQTAASANWLFGAISLDDPSLSWLRDDTASLSNAQIVLTDAATNGARYSQSTAIDLDGGYYFDQVSVGQYQLHMTLPAGYNTGINPTGINLADGEVAEVSFTVGAAEEGVIFLPVVQ